MRPCSFLSLATLTASPSTRRSLLASAFRPPTSFITSRPARPSVTTAAGSSLKMSSATPTSSSSSSSSIRKPIYLDHNGTTPIYPAVLTAMMPYLTHQFGNPSSGHIFGREPKKAVALARRQLMALLDPTDSNTAADSADDSAQSKAEEAIIFTGCGTEADNLAIQLAILASPPPSDGGSKRHVVTCVIEHPAILECLKVLEERGEIDLTVVPVDKEGIVSADEIDTAIVPDKTVLVTVMTVNNEVGSVQPIADIARHCQKHGVLFHTDAAQAVGKVSVELADLGNPDMITIVGHKMGAPKGIAALYVRPGCLSEGGRTIPHGYGSCGLSMLGGGQECGRRAGTENVPYIAGLGAAAELLTRPSKEDQTQPQWRSNTVHMENLRSRLLQRLTDALGESNVRTNGPADAAKRSPSTLSVGLKNVQSGELLRNLSDVVAASAGSACHASGGGISEVLKALKVPEEFARGTLRLSVGPVTTMDEIEDAADIIIEEAKRHLNK